MRKRYFIVIVLCLIITMLAVPLGAFAAGTSAESSYKRIYGSNRYGTAAEIAKKGWTVSDYAILASGENFPDALCASPLAAKYNAPILLTSKSSLPEETKEQLLVLNVTKVIIIGGTGVISEKVAEAIGTLGIDVSRLAGDNRYETSLRVAKEMGDFTKAVIASGLSYQDVLSMASIAAKAEMPIILTPKDEITYDTKSLLAQHVQETYVLGDTKSISNKVYNELVNPKRLTGSNWYELNTNIIETFADTLNLGTCYLATGTAYPDALAGAVFASLSGSPLLLVSNPLDRATQDFLDKYSDKINRFVAFGGTAAISEILLDGIDRKEEYENNQSSPITNLSAVPQSTNQINLTWNHVPNATAYYVYKSSAYDGTYERVAIITSPYYMDNYLAAGTTYYYKVQAVQNGEVGSYSNRVAVTTLGANNGLNAPGNVKANVVGDNQVNLSWNTVSGALYYTIYRATSAEGSYTSIAIVSTPHYQDNELNLGATHYYKIQASNNTYSSPHSSVVQAQALVESSSLAAPSNVKASSFGAGQIYLNWDSVDKATFYNVYRATAGFGNYDLIASMITPFHIDNSVTSGTTYYYKVQAGNGSGVGSFSNAVNANSIITNDLGVPPNIKAVAISSTEISLTWEKVQHATYYTIYRATAGTGDYDVVGTVSTSYFTDSKCVPQTTYDYKIQAGSNIATGAQSGPVSVKTQ